MKKILFWINEWIDWRLFRPKGAFKGWWNMSEEELRSESTIKRLSAMEEAGEIFVKYGIFVDYAKLYRVIEKGAEDTLNMDLKLKKEQK